MKKPMHEVLDYIRCPMLYKLRHVDKLDTTYTGLRSGSYLKFNPHHIEEAFDIEVHKLGYHLFNYIQDGKYPSEYLLRQKWSNLWCKDKTTEDIMFESTSFDGMGVRTRLERMGLKVIEQMIPKFKENPGVPLLVGKHATFKLGKHTMTVTIDLVREVTVEGGPIIEVMDFNTNMKTKWHTKPLNLHIHQDLGMTAASLAFRQLTGIDEHRITYYDMVHDNEYTTSRTAKHFKVLENVLDQVEFGIDNNIYYPVMNDRCFECPFQYECQKGDWYNE